MFSRWETSPWYISVKNKSFQQEHITSKISSNKNLYYNTRRYWINQSITFTFNLSYPMVRLIVSVQTANVNESEIKMRDKN